MCLCVILSFNCELSVGKITHSYFLHRRKRMSLQYCSAFLSQMNVSIRKKCCKQSCLFFSSFHPHGLFSIQCVISPVCILLFNKMGKWACKSFLIFFPKTGPFAMHMQKIGMYYIMINECYMWCLSYRNLCVVKISYSVD